MKLLILNQAFYPDVVSSAQHAADFACALSDAGHEVTVICSRRAYDEASSVFPRRQIWKGIRIERVGSTALGKGARWRRAADFATFVAACTFRLLFLPRFDAIVTLTSPPLLSFVAALAVPLKAKRLVSWSMDLNPDQAIAAGWLREESRTARLFSRLSLYSLRKADRIIALDRFMKQRIQAKGIDEAKISVIPPWAHDEYVRFDPAGREEFRARYGLTQKFVVMYSGNHSPCHPLDTLLQAAERLANREEIVFCLVGGGSVFREILRDVGLHRIRNIVCIPYQPINKLAASLSAADLHVVVMGDPFVGIVHPCKIYNILTVGTPFLYVGPREGHVADILAEYPRLGHAHRHGDVDEVVDSITAACAQHSCISSETIAEQFSSKRLVPEMVHAVEELMPEVRSGKTTPTEEGSAGEPESTLLS
ncbi:MAG: glycosyltransferase family 4 protein [Candidatus Korobacteraceae bacterium]|jgi:glycosyltransferase involved in cell wall biosynthesis